jgi:hypothetical protein
MPGGRALGRMQIKKQYPIIILELLILNNNDYENSAYSFVFGLFLGKRAGCKPRI